MQAGESIVVCGGGDLCDTRQSRVPPALRVGAQAGQPVSNEFPIKVWKPPLTKEGKLDATTPLTGPQAGVTGDAPPGPRVAIQVERISKTESNQVSNRLSAHLAGLPVDDT